MLRPENSATPANGEAAKLIVQSRTFGPLLSKLWTQEASVRESLGNRGADGHIFRQNIPRKQSLANSAGNDVAYLKDNDIAKLFDRFGDELMQRLVA